MKKILAIVIALVVLAAGVFLALKFIKPVGNENSDINKNPTTTQATQPTINAERKMNMAIDVTALLEDPSVADDDMKDYIPTDGFVLKAIDFEFKENEDALAFLQRICAEKQIHLDVDTSGSFAYVKGIGNIYAGKAGEMSGWSYKVNGEFAMVGANEHILKKDDKIEWIFLTSFEEM